MNNSFRRSIASILIAGSIPALVQTAAYAEGEQPAVTSDSADSATLQPSATSSTPVKSSVPANDEPATSTSPAAKGGVVVNSAGDPHTSDKQEK